MQLDKVTPAVVLENVDAETPESGNGPNLTSRGGHFGTDIASDSE